MVCGGSNCRGGDTYLFSFFLQPLFVFSKVEIAVSRRHGRRENVQQRFPNAPLKNKGGG